MVSVNKKIGKIVIGMNQTFFKTPAAVGCFQSAVVSIY